LDKDTALSYLHDLGFIPKIVKAESVDLKLGGGLGSQPHHEITIIYSVNQIIPTTEGVLRYLIALEKEPAFKSTYEILIKDMER
jgi:sulfite reductase (ferredoxin)